jgi:hypothetical protein
VAEEMKAAMKVATVAAKAAGAALAGVRAEVAMAGVGTEEVATA